MNHDVCLHFLIEIIDFNGPRVIIYILFFQLRDEVVT
jgi:hypothetical protein